MGNAKKKTEKKCPSGTTKSEKETKLAVRALRRAGFLYEPIGRLLAITTAQAFALADEGRQELPFSVLVADNKIGELVDGKLVPTPEAANDARRDILHLICKWWSPAIVKGRGGTETLDGAIGLLYSLLGERHGAGPAQFEHLRPMIDVLERARAGEPLRVLISAPPQHGKTTLLRHFITSDVVKRPHHASIYATYSIEKARVEGRLVREAASRSGVKVEKIGVDDGTWLPNLYLQAPGFGIHVPTGKNIGCIYVDDPIKDAEEAESPTIRDKIFDWFQFDLRQRIGADIPIVVVGARWHHDDLIGRLSAEKGPSGEPVWTLINLPAIDDYGAPLWPEARPLAFLLKIKRTLTAYFWSALYMGRPDPQEGAV